MRVVDRTRALPSEVQPRVLPAHVGDRAASSSGSMRTAGQVLAYCLCLGRTFKMHQFFLFCKQVRPQIPFRGGVVNNIICTSLGVSPSRSVAVQEEEEMKSLNLLLVSCKQSNY